MSQVITIPEKAIEHQVSEINFLIIDKANIRTRVVIGRRLSESENPFQFTPTTVNAQEVIDSELANGNLTEADIQGLRKIFKALAAKAIGISFEELNDVI